MSENIKRRKKTTTLCIKWKEKWWTQQQLENEKCISNTLGTLQIKTDM
jgi:hypothetical protein